MKVIGISGSPRKGGNMEYLLQESLEAIDRNGGKTVLIRLAEREIEPCKGCRACVELGECTIKDGMQEIYKKLIEAEAVILASPVFFNNVSAQMKAFMDRTWCIRGRLSNKIGGAIAVGRRYGIEGAIEALNAYLLKHEMILANRGVSGFAYEKGEITHDELAITDAQRLGERIVELVMILRGVEKDV